MTTKNLQFVPCYYEWHLTDEEGNILHNMVLDLEDLFHEDGTQMELDEVIELCEDDLLAAQQCYLDGEEHNGVKAEWKTPKEIALTANVMATALYNYYFA